MRKLLSNWEKKQTENIVEPCWCDLGFIACLGFPPLTPCCLAELCYQLEAGEEDTKPLSRTENVFLIAGVSNVHSSFQLLLLDYDFQLWFGLLLFLFVFSWLLLTLYFISVRPFSFSFHTVSLQHTWIVINGNPDSEHLATVNLSFNSG